MASVDTQLLRLWLLAAAAVTVARGLGAAVPGYDQSMQILAAQNLLAGRGLSWYVRSGLDLTDPPALVTLTHFPAGYSLAAAALFALGLSVALVVKLTGAAGTLVGWWGWGRLARPFFAEGLRRSVGWRCVAFVVAVTAPLLFTPRWDGTDLFLWATIPWVLQCLVRAADDHTRRGSALDCAAGFLCGLAFFTRYASAFLPAYAGVVILWQSAWRWRSLIRRLIFFGFGLVPLVAIQIGIIALARGSAVTPGGLNTAQAAPVHRLFEGLSLLHNAGVIWAFWLPGKVLSLLFSDPAPGRLPWQLVLVAGAAALLLMVALAFASDTDAPSRDLRLVSLGLFIVIPGMLLAAMMSGRYAYVSDQRYYLPAVPLSLFVAYSVAAMRSVRERTASITVAGACGWLYIAGYVAMALVYVVLLPAPVGPGAAQRSKLLGGEPTRWPSSVVVYELSSARELAMRLVRERPGTLLVASQPVSFSWDPKVDRSRLIYLACDVLDARHVKGPARIVFVTFEKGRPRDLWSYSGNSLTGTVVRADCLDSLTDLQVVQRFPNEGMKVLVEDVAAGRDIVMHR